MNTRRIQKKRPKKSWTSKKIQIHEFVGKKNKKTASGGLRPPWGGPSGHLGGLATPWSYVTFQILWPCNNRSYTPITNFPEIQDQRRKKERKIEIFFEIKIFY